MIYVQSWTLGGCFCIHCWSVHFLWLHWKSDFQWHSREHDLWHHKEFGSQSCSNMYVSTGVEGQPEASSAHTRRMDSTVKRETFCVLHLDPWNKKKQTKKPCRFKNIPALKTSNAAASSVALSFKLWCSTYLFSVLEVCWETVHIVGHLMTSGMLLMILNGCRLIRVRHQN